MFNLNRIIPETYNFIKKYSRPYPNEQFLRRFHYFNESWLKYKKEVKCEIIADSLNKKSIKRNNMRMKIYKNNDIKNIQLPMIFNFKNQNMKFK